MREEQEVLAHHLGDQHEPPEEIAGRDGVTDFTGREIERHRISAARDVNDERAAEHRRVGGHGEARGRMLGDGALHLCAVVAAPRRAASGKGNSWHPAHAADPARPTRGDRHDDCPESPHAEDGTPPTRGVIPGIFLTGRLPSLPRDGNHSS